MVNYQNGKIYKIVCYTTGKVYIGSTTKQYLSQRLSDHIRCYRCYLNTGRSSYMRSYDVLENNNYEILLLEEYPCSSKDALHTRERFYTQSKECVNKVKNQGLLAELGQKEYDKQQNKAYREKNKESISEKSKQSYQKNRESVLKRVSEYRQNNQEKIKNYRERNKEAIKEKSKQTYTCVCGSCLRIDAKAKHERTKKHQDYLKSLETVEIP